ncbi:MAG: hypothetical protein LW857_07380, partial [Verrucomicrobiae bacterium]|nr:hypothetical protein [Verrucomicrobiae bacterium]
MAFIVKAPTSDRGQQDRLAALRLDGIDVITQTFRVGRESPDPLALLFLVVVSELDEHEVILTQLREDLVESMLGLERTQGATGLRVVGDHRAFAHEERERLAPTDVGLVRLVGHRRIARKEDTDRRRRGGVDRHDRGAGGRAEEFERQPLVPSRVAGLPGFEGHAATGVFRTTHIDQEALRHRPTPRHGDVERQQAARLGLHRRHRSDIRSAEFDGHLVDPL